MTQLHTAILAVAASVLLANWLLRTTVADDFPPRPNPPYPDEGPVDIPKSWYSRIPPAQAAESYDTTCERYWKSASGTQVFMRWLVKIIWDPFLTPGPMNKPFSLATGMAITTRHILTAWSPFVIYIKDESGNQNIRVVEYVIQYSKAEPLVEEYGKFPWAADNPDEDKSKGCQLATHKVGDWFMVAHHKIFRNFSKPFKDYTNNFLLLVLSTAISVLEWPLWQRAPFDYSTEEGNAFSQLSWLQNNNQVRCQIPRFNTTIDSEHRLGFARIEQKGFTYKALKYKGKCARLLCKLYCKDRTTQSWKPKIGITAALKCEYNCKKWDDHLIKKKKLKLRNKPGYEDVGLAKSFFMKLFCLKRLKERQMGEKEMYSLNYDEFREDKKFFLSKKDRNIAENCHEQTTGPIGSQQPDISVLYGAPLVCDGQVVAMVVKCLDEVLIAAPLLLIRDVLLDLNPDVEFFRQFYFIKEGGKRVKVESESLLRSSTLQGN